MTSQGNEFEAHKYKILLDQKLAENKMTKSKFWAKYVSPKCGVGYSYLVSMLNGYGSLRDDIKEIINNYPGFSASRSVNFLDKLDELVESGKLKNYSLKSGSIYVYFPDAMELTGCGKGIIKELKDNPRFLEYGRVVSTKSGTKRMLVFSCFKFCDLKRIYDKAQDSDILHDEETGEFFPKKDKEFKLSIAAALSVKWKLNRRPHDPRNTNRPGKINRQMGADC